MSTTTPPVARLRVKLTARSEPIDLTAQLQRIVAERDAARQRGDRPPASHLIRP